MKYNLTATQKDTVLMFMSDYDCTRTTATHILIKLDWDYAKATDYFYKHY